MGGFIMDKFKKWLDESIETIEGAINESGCNSRDWLKDRLYMLNLVKENYNKFNNDSMK
jgi:hypothetical protein